MLTTWPRVVNPRNTGAPKATVTDFDQNTYVPGGFDRALSVDTIGQHFVPPARGQGAERKLVVALHGRQSGTPRPARAPRTFRLKSAPDRGRRRNGPSNEPDASCFPGRR
ncbi:hypothetical protein [Streptomyces chiangmaiensis]|uniref:hypothetical protein n=1 Tax=Streptomyces chiangmaiensis TaxID=766497 RepID=UPI00362CA502